MPDESSNELVLASQALVARTENLRALQAVVLELENQRQELYEAGDYATLSAGAQDLEVIASDLRDLLNETRRNIATILDEIQGQVSSDGTYYFGINRMELPGVGMVEVNGGWTRTKWRSEDLLRYLVNQIAEASAERIVTADGEVVEVAQSQLLYDIIKVVKETMPLTASLSWKVGTETKAGTKSGLKKHGVDDRDWCERTPKTRLATVPKRKLT